MAATEKPKIVMAWYKRAQWPQLRLACAEPGRLAESYDEWLADATGHLAQMRSRGLLVSRVIVDVGDLVAWCARRSRPVAPEAASEFAASLAQQGRGVLDW